MTALQLNAEPYRNLGIIAEDKTMLDKVVKYVRKLAKQMTDLPHTVVMMITNRMFVQTIHNLLIITLCSKKRRR